MGWAETGSSVGDRLWRAQNTLPREGELLLSLVVTAGGTLSNPGMECCSMSSLACSQVRGSVQTIFAASVQQETQGTNMVVRGGDDAAYAEIPHTDNVGLSAALELCYRIRTAVRWRVHTVAGNRVDLIGVGCRDSREAASPRVLLIYVQYVQTADSDRALGEARS